MTIPHKFKLTKKLAVKVLEVVDAGLCSGIGKPVPGEMCVEAAVCYAMGLPHGDEPTCVSPVLRSLKISLNDNHWSSKAVRAKGLRRLAIAQLGSAGVLDEKEFTARVVKNTISKVVPRALRHAASIHPILKRKLKLEDAAKECEEKQNKQSTDSACAAAAFAASNTTDYAAHASADAAFGAARAARHTKCTVAVQLTACAAGYAALSEAAADKELSLFAEEIVQILIEMKAPGTKYLSLTEAP